MRILALLAFVTIAAATVTGGAAYWVWIELSQPRLIPAGGVVVSIAPGQPFARTAKQLEDDGLAPHHRLLAAYARYHSLDRQIRSGDYRIDRPLSAIELLDLLRTSPLALHQVTIREGLTVQQIGRLLEESGYGGRDEYECLATDASFLASVRVPPTGLEGYLFPDTYTLTKDASPEEILRGMVTRFREAAGELLAERAAAEMSERDMVTLASVIERETGVVAERPIISAVFHNRLRIGMRLQSDPTAIYPWKEGVPTAADLRVPSPWNTYQVDGLPKGPICNPGQAAMAAAVSPSDDNYLYFVAKGGGAHTFSRTYAEHKRAVRALRRLRHGH